MLSILYGVEENYKCQLNKQFEKIADLGNDEIIKKVYEVNYLFNFEDNFGEGYLLITNKRLLVINCRNLEKISEEILEIRCIFIHYETFEEVLIQVESGGEIVNEIILRASRKKLTKIVKKISKYYEYIAQVKMKIYESGFAGFTTKCCIDYLNLCYTNVIRNYQSPCENKETLSDYKLLKFLGEGSNGKVLLMRNKKSSRIFAVKVLGKLKIIEDGLFRYIRSEIFILQHLKNPFMLQMQNFFQTENNLYLVTDYVGPDLYDLLNYHKIKYLSESDVKFYIVCIASAIQSLHDNKFTYRDLKPENILIGSDGYPILCDFGLVNLLHPSHKAYTMCGTPQYFAPELIISNSYDNRVDWWTLGILTYELLFGTPPFSCENTYTLYDHILHTDITFPNTIPISNAAKDLISKLLNKNPDLRLGSKKGIYELFNHKFFKNVDFVSILNKYAEAPNIFRNGENDLSSYSERDIGEEEICSYSPDELSKIKLHKIEFELLK